MTIAELIEKHLDQTHPLDFGVRALKDYSIELLELVKEQTPRPNVLGKFPVIPESDPIDKALEELRK